MWYPFGEQWTDVTVLKCPTHCNGGTGHDNNLPLFILMALVNHLPKMIDIGDWEGRKGPIEIKVCGALIEMGVWKVMTKWQTSWILSTTVEPVFHVQLESDGNTELNSPWPMRSFNTGLEHQLQPFPEYSILQSKISCTILQKIPSTFSTHEGLHCQE